MLLSIIIPIYNGAKFLQRTIDSVLCQGLNDVEYELILINDGSTDNTLDICNYYKNRYKNIMYYSKGNEGPSMSRNKGLEMASGDYVYFMDADDYLMPNGLRYILDTYYEKDLDVIVFCGESIKNFNDLHYPSGTIEGKIVFDGWGTDFLKNNYQTFVWNQIYKRSFLISNKLRFSNVSLCEDTLFNLQVWSKNPRVRILSSKIYRYILYPGNGQLSTKRSKDYIRDNIRSYMYLFSIIAQLDKTYTNKYHSDGLKRMFQWQLIPFMSRLLSSDLSVSEFRYLINSLYKNGLLPYKTYYNKYAKVFFLLTKTVPIFPIYKYFYKSIFLSFILPKLSRE